MVETTTSNTAENLLQSQEPRSLNTWMKPLLLDFRMKAQSPAHPVDDSETKLTSVQQIDEVSLHALSDYSKSILQSIVLGNNSANKNRLLREIYWHTVEVLANQE